MKKTLFVVLSLLGVFGTAAGRDFSAVNGDGVEIHYSILSTDTMTVAVAAHSYTGRVVVPETVMYNDTTWSVISIGTAFRNTAVTYLELPQTVKSFEYRSLHNCTQLDTLRLNSTEVVIPPTRSGRINPLYIFSERFSGRYTGPTVVVVPCGSLQTYRNGGYTIEGNGMDAGFYSYGWSNIITLTSDCAVPITVVPTMDSIYILDSVSYTSRGLVYNNLDYEIGDTAFVAVGLPYYQYNDYAMRLEYPHWGYFYGWSTGSTDKESTFIVEGADTILCYVDTFRYANLSVNHISTPVYQFGTLSYNGSVANYRFDDMQQPIEEWVLDSTGEYQPVATDEYYSPSTIFASALWVCSFDSMSYERRHYQDEEIDTVVIIDSMAVTKVAAVRFFGEGTDYFPGPLRIGTATTDLETMMRYNRVWHVSREMIDYHIAHCADTGYTPVDDILNWPGNGDSANGFATQLAPYYDADGNGRYDARHGDYPLIRGDECVFSIFNDGWGTHTESLGTPLGIEIHAMTYAFREPADTALWNTVFVHYDIYNRSSEDRPNTVFGAWTDFDLGYAYDDFIGCDVSRGMYYCYNGDGQDGPGTGSFVGMVPAQGCVILGGPTLPADGQDNPAITVADYPAGFVAGDTLGNMGINGLNFGDGIADNERMGMTSFIFYHNEISNTGEPRKAADYYCYMNSQWLNYQHLKYGGKGYYQGVSNLDTRFMFPDDSDPWHWGTDGVVPEVNPNDWNEITSGIDVTPGDRRGIGTSGNFTFEQGSCQQFDIAYTTGFAPEEQSWAAVESLKRNVDNMRRQFVRDTTDSGRPFTYRPYSAPVEPVGIARISSPEMKLYPNPTNGMVTVVTEGDAPIQLMDMYGRIIMTDKCVGGRLTLDLTPLPQGVYILRAGTAVRRIVKK